MNTQIARQDFRVPQMTRAATPSATGQSSSQPRRRSSWLATMRDTSTPTTPNARLLKTTRSEVIGRHFADFVPRLILNHALEDRLFCEIVKGAVLYVGLQSPTSRARLPHAKGAGLLWAERKAAALAASLVLADCCRHETQQGGSPRSRRPKHPVAAAFAPFPAACVFASLRERRLLCGLPSPMYGRMDR